MVLNRQQQHTEFSLCLNSLMVKLNWKCYISSAEGFVIMHPPAYRTELAFLRDKRRLSVVLHYAIRLTGWKPGEERG